MASEYDMTIERTLNAPREKVWAAWTDANKVQQWWAPNGMTAPTCQWDVRPGGKINIVMLAGSELGEMAGMEAPMTGIFQEVEAPSKLVFTGNAIMNGKKVLENLVTVTLDEEHGKTKLTIKVKVTMTTPEAAGPLSGMQQGWTEQTDKLVKFVESEA